MKDLTDKIAKDGSLDLSGDESLKNLDGLANCTKLTYLKLLDCSSLLNVDGLADCTSLTDLNLSDCGLVQPRSPTDRMQKRTTVAAYQGHIRKAMK